MHFGLEHQKESVFFHANFQKVNSEIYIHSHFKRTWIFKFFFIKCVKNFWKIEFILLWKSRRKYSCNANTNVHNVCSLNIDHNLTLPFQVYKGFYNIEPELYIGNHCIWLQTCSFSSVPVCFKRYRICIKIMV